MLIMQMILGLISNGNEVGAYDELWIPGGYTIHGTKEAVISNSENLIHNKDWDTFINFFWK